MFVEFSPKLASDDEHASFKISIAPVAAGFAEDDEGFVDVADFDRSQGSQQRFEQRNFIVGKGNHIGCSMKDVAQMLSAF